MKYKCGYSGGCTAREKDMMCGASESRTCEYKSKPLPEPPHTVSPSVRRASDWLLSVAQMLAKKNAQYGDSAANPIRIFSQSDSVEGLKVRIDDKLSRIARGNGEGNEDAIKDLVGYLAFLATSEGNK